jgi:hypothetical protein
VSGVAVINYLLSHDAAVLGAVQDANILTGDLPLATSLPALGVSMMSAVRRNTTSMNGAKVLVTERVQVTARASTYAGMKALLPLTLLACRNRSGTVNGVELDSILPDGQGPDFQDDASVHTGSQDFIVKWKGAH